MSVVLLNFKLEVRKMTRMERINSSFTSPVLYYGKTESSFVYDGLCHDQRGRVVTNSKGQITSVRYVKKKEHICPFNNREEAVERLRIMYEEKAALYNHHRYAPFLTCIRDVEPESPRIHPELHGVRLVMYPTL